MTNIFPLLKDYCRERYNVEFQVQNGFLSFLENENIFTTNLLLRAQEKVRNLLKEHKITRAFADNIWVAHCYRWLGNGHFIDPSWNPYMLLVYHSLDTTLFCLIS